MLIGKVVGREESMSQASSYMELESMSQLGSTMRGLSKLFNNKNGIDSADEDTIKNFVAKKLRIQAKKMEKVHNLELKNIRKVMMQMTVDWLKEKCRSIQEMFTKNHRGLFSQFKDYKTRTGEQLELLDIYYEKLKAAEMFNAAKLSIDEVDYLFKSEQYGLKLYDSIVLELEEHQKVKKMSLEARLVYQKEKQQNKEEAEGRQIDHLKQVNKILEERNRQLEEEMNLIQWYIAVMEDGKDTKEVLEDYVRMKYLVDEVEGKIEKNKLKYTDEITKIK